MTDYERTVLDHYLLSSPYPVEWPAEKDLSDASDDDDEEEAKLNRKVVRRSKSRYSALERVASDRKSLVPGSQKTGDGVENLVQRDESDPLGTTDSVVRILKQLGLPVSDDTRLRKYCSKIIECILTEGRQPISPVIDDLLSRPFPVPSSFDCIHTGSFVRTRCPLEIYRPEIRISESPRRV